jgi:hypothetical protein
VNKIKDRTIVNIMLNDRAKGIHKGDKTHNQDQVIIPDSFKTMNINNRK